MGTAVLMFLVSIFFRLGGLVLMYPTVHAYDNKEILYFLLYMLASIAAGWIANIFTLVGKSFMADAKQKHPAGS